MEELRAQESHIHLTHSRPRGCGCHRAVTKKLTRGSRPGLICRGGRWAERELPEDTASTATGRGHQVERAWPGQGWSSSESHRAPWLNLKMENWNPEWNYHFVVFLQYPLLSKPNTGPAGKRGMFPRSKSSITKQDKEGWIWS